MWQVPKELYNYNATIYILGLGSQEGFLEETEDLNMVMEDRRDLDGGHDGEGVTGYLQVKWIPNAQGGSLNLKSLLMV